MDFGDILWYYTLPTQVCQTGYSGCNAHPADNVVWIFSYIQQRMANDVNLYARTLASMHLRRCRVCWITVNTEHRTANHLIYYPSLSLIFFFFLLLDFLSVHRNGCKCECCVRLCAYRLLYAMERKASANTRAENPSYDVLQKRWDILYRLSLISIHPWRVSFVFYGSTSKITGTET